MEPTATLDIPLGPDRRRILRVLADQWSMWLLIAVHEQRGARFSELASEPGLSRRVLSERLRVLTHEGFLAREQYQVRPVRHHYVLTERGRNVQRLALELVHVAAGGSLAPTTRPLAPVGRPLPVDAHPMDQLLAGDLDLAARVHADTIAPLERHDAQYRSALLDTLATWLACDASVSVAAAQLFAHRHTIRYRLDRVREITGLDTSVLAERERLALGLRARAVLESTGLLPLP